MAAIADILVRFLIPIFNYCITQSTMSDDKKRQFYIFSEDDNALTALDQAKAKNDIEKQIEEARNKNKDAK